CTRTLYYYGSSPFDFW
nr:immunoglobulin heavy chain junction region [Mus musculus]